MYEIVDKQQFSANVVKFEVKAPRVAAARRPGHFVIVINDAQDKKPTFYAILSFKFR